MRNFSRYPRLTLSLLIIVSTIMLLTQCVGREQTHEPAPDLAATYKKFAGSAACASCHKQIAESHIHTAHYLTSRPADAGSIAGSFDPGKNNYAFSASRNISMEKRDSGFFQVLYENGVADVTRRFDITVGSSAHGQTFLSWSQGQLTQLPISYFSETSQWSNSPGYPGKPAFNRPITARCLECHSTYVQVNSPDGVEPEVYDKKNIIYGVDCEKCHGPAAAHVEFQSRHPEAKTAKYIVNPAYFTRQQSLDLCALCHGGKLIKSRPSFSFQPGDTLSNYFNTIRTPMDVVNIDVHGNQYGLLSASKCFEKSNMTCNSCHNTHENQRGQTAYFSQKCLTCHAPESAHQASMAPACKLAKTIGSSINKNCIDCHMPVQSSHAIAVLLQGSQIPTLAHMRSHLIRIYPEESKRILDSTHLVHSSKPKSH